MTLADTVTHATKAIAASAAIITALLQGKPACKQENSGTKQVKTTPK